MIIIFISKKNMKFSDVLQMHTIEFEDGLNFSEDVKNNIDDFISFLYDKLNLQEEVFIKIASDREKNGLVTTAFYRDKDKYLCIYGKNRLGIDICRSIAHELVHKKQYEQNRVPNNPQDVGGKIENEANSVAGQLVKIFTKKYQPKALFN